MKSVSNLIKIVGLLAVVVAATPVFSSDAHAYACKGNQYSGAATKNTKFMARAGARISWQNHVKSQFGLPWSVWSISQGKSIQCHKTGAKHTCLALARPCKYVVQ